MAVFLFGFTAGGDRLYTYMGGIESSRLGVLSIQILCTRNAIIMLLSNIA